MIGTIEQPRTESGVSLWLNRIQSEYREMPGLSLTRAQMLRLWSLEPHVCDALIDSLVCTNVLRRTPRGCYVAYDA